MHACALEDARDAVSLCPGWGKAHGRCGAAHVGLKDWARAEAAYREGLMHEPGSAMLQQGLDEVMAMMDKLAAAA